MSRRRAFEDNEITLSHHNKRPCSGLISCDRYTVAWICALPIEMAAARAMLDEEHRSDLRDNLRNGLRNDPLLKDDLRNEPLVRDHPLPINEYGPAPRDDDGNSYVLGTIQRQNVVLACLPYSEYGTNNAAIVMSNLKRTFPKIKICLMVGIGGGVPTKADIRLGDIVVGIRIMQSDLGKTVEGELQRTAVPRILGYNIGTVVSNLRSRHELEGSRVPMILENKMHRYPAFGLPDEPDRLFHSSYGHPVHASTCNECDESRIEKRAKRSSTNPIIHYGGIASGNQVMKDAVSRDKIATELDIICFEMEAAGIMNIEPCLPIRGICDYSDSHKAKEWQRYAAATAAAYAYELLEVRGQHTRDVDSVEILSTVEDKSPASTERHDQLLESLNFEAIDARKTNIKAAHSKTCHWFLKQEDYLAWKDHTKLLEHHGFLWIRGKPGAGKSTIMKFIYLQTKRLDRKNQVLTASFFFNARGEVLERTTSGMYRSLLLQLFKGFPDLQCVLDDSDILPQNQVTCPSLNCLKNLLRSAVLELGRRSFTCFIDALDECDEQQVRDLVGFFEDVAETCTENNICLRICFSSRHYPYIDIDRGMRLTVENQEGHAGDLESYIKSKLKIKDPTLVAELQAKMLEKASGVFLWIVLVVDLLNDENRRGRLNLRRRLEKVPNGLSELFKEILRRDNADAEQLQLCLFWILFSKRPLKPEEYYHALWSGLSADGLADSEMPSVNISDATDCFYKSVISSSKGLAEITKAKKPIVQFIHESVRDFLIKDKGLAELWPEQRADWEGLGHEKLKQCCSYYFQLWGYQESPASLGPAPPDMYRYPFLEYATHHVLSHAESATNSFCQKGFLHQFPKVYWIDMANAFERHNIRKYSPAASMLYVLADRGYASLIRSEVDNYSSFNSPCNQERYVYPLIAAMAQGHKDSVVALLGLSSPIRDGVDITKSIAPNVNSGNKRHTTLSWACEHGHLGIAKLLVEMGVSRDPKGGLTLLMYAVKGGRLEVAKWLLDIGEDIRATTKSYSVISLAVESSNGELVKFLLDRGIDPNFIIPKRPMPAAHLKGSANQSILHLASYCGYVAVSKAILEKGGDIEIPDLLGMRPIHYARSRAVLETLLDYGADINTCDYVGQTCLWDTIVHPDRESFYLLIERGVDVNIRRNDGKSCLFLAVQLGKIDIINFLCSNGANLDIQDNEGDTCLHHARFDHDYTRIVETLLEKGANPNVAGSGGQTFLHRFTGCMGLLPLIDHTWFQIFEKHSVDVNARDYCGNTPLHLASGQMWVENLDVWLSHRAEINPRNNQGETPLDIAIREGNRAGAAFLICRGAKKGSEITI